MKYCAFSKWSWLFLLWMQGLCIFDMVVLQFDPLAHQIWWFILVCLVQPVCAIVTLVFRRKHKGIVQLRRIGDTWRWRLV